MLYISTHGNDNRVPLFITDTAENTILGVTGSGHVIIGGKGPPPTEAKLNVSGSDLEQLISLKADSIGQVFYVSASGELWNSGSATFKSPEPYLHLSSSVDTAGKAKIGLNSSNNILIQNNTNNKHIVFKTNDNGTTKEGLRLDGAVPEVVVNQTAESLINFRVESKNNTHMLYVTGSNQVGVGVSDPAIGVTLDISGSAMRLRNSSTPANAGSVGVQGEIRWDANYIYVCIATDTWKRVAIGTW
jgi:hypothetical protein